MIPSDILLITDTVENRVVYSFNDTNTGGKVENTALTSTHGVVYDEDTDFPNTNKLQMQLQRYILTQIQKHPVQ